MLETVLVVDDDENDQFFIARALKQLKAVPEVQFVNTGEAAISYLKGHPPFADRKHSPLPSVVFMDIKMPGKTGFEVLEWLKTQNEAFRRVPVVMVSSSASRADVNRAYELGASAYLVKPVRTDELQKLFKITGEFFLEHAERPSVFPP